MSSKNNYTTKKQRENSVAVARDVLKTIRYLDIRPGCYLAIAGFEDYDGDKKLQTPLEKVPLKNCVVCAKGAMVVSYARLYDNTTVGEAYNKQGFKEFGDENANLIEGCFEGWAVVSRYCFPYYSHFPDHKDRLRAIMENVIRNEGVFRPEQDVDGE